MLLNFSDKINLKRSDRYVALSNISIYYTRKNTKTSYKNNNFKISTPDGMISLNYLMDDVLYLIFHDF